MYGKKEKLYLSRQEIIQPKMQYTLPTLEVYDKYFRQTIIVCDISLLGALPMNERVHPFITKMCITLDIV